MQTPLSQESNLLKFVNVERFSFLKTDTSGGQNKTTGWQTSIIYSGGRAHTGCNGFVTIAT
jgi:hypothetical protein